jgi:uncharacterized GH25 family protein
MKRTVPTAALVVIAGAALATVAAAHDLFVKMDRYHLPPGAAVQVPIINGTFQQSENSITPDRVADVSLVTQGRRSRLGLDTWNAEGDTTFLGLRTGDPGTYVLGVSTRPNRLTLEAADFNLYLASDGVVDVLEQRALDGELDEGAREEYSKHVKGVFQVGDRRTGGLDVVFGHPAELVPLGNPYEMTVGGELSFRALVDGEPVGGQLVIAGGEASGTAFAEREARTNADGIVSFEMDRPGRWYVKFINMQRTDAQDLDYESKWATISFEIR